MEARSTGEKASRPPAYSRVMEMNAAWERAAPSSASSRPQQSVHRKVHLEGVQNGAGADDRHDDLGEPLAGGGRQDLDLHGGEADGQHQKHLHDLLEKEHIHLRHDSTSENAPAYPPERRSFDNRILTQTEPMSKKK